MMKRQERLASLGDRQLRSLAKLDQRRAIFVRAEEFARLRYRLRISTDVVITPHPPRTLAEIRDGLAGFARAR